MANDKIEEFIIEVFDSELVTLNMEACLINLHISEHYTYCWKFIALILLSQPFKNLWF